LAPGFGALKDAQALLEKVRRLYCGDNVRIWIQQDERNLSRLRKTLLLITCEGIAMTVVLQPSRQ